MHDIAQPLIGYEGDVRRTKAEVIVRRDEVGVASNDIGFAKKPDGTFEAIISAFDRSHYGKAWLERLSHAYSLRAVDSFAAAQGFEIVESVPNAEGEVRLLLRRG